jgi:hypothetical protein
MIPGPRATASGTASPGRERWLPHPGGAKGYASSLAAGGIVAFLLLVTPAAGQQVGQRGFLEGRGTVYPQDTPYDTTNAVANVILREELFWRPSGWLTLAGGVDAQMDTHGRVEREWRVDWDDRGARRPAVSIRRLSAAARRAGVTFEAGKQFVRWGKADVLNPTDRFAPRDFMEVVDNEFLGITAARLIWERKTDTLDAVWARFTPSRVPLPTDRWAALPAPPAGASPGAAKPQIVDAGASYPGRAQVGIRWNRLARGFEFSLSAYDGFNHLPTFEARVASVPGVVPPVIEFSRAYPRMRTFGGDAAVPLRWLTLKGEAAYFASPDGQADEYAIYVLQVERQSGEWFFVGGYAGEVLGKRRAAPPPGTADSTFALDRGLAKSFLGRASCTIDVNRSVAFEGALRQDANGLWLKAEYSQAAGQHLRATLRGHLIRGDQSDFLGKYRLNSGVEGILRYSY